MLCPKPRQYRDSKADVAGWTNWQGISIPGDGSFNPGPQNAANLNAGIGGGVANEFGSEPGSHGLCGDIGSRHGFTAPGRYGPTDPRGTYVAGGTMEVTARITAWHAGWFEFRLGVPADGGGNKEIPMTQALLNEHVLEIDPSTKDYDKVMNYAGMKGLGNWQDDGGLYKCPYTGGDATTGTPTNANPSAGFEDTTSNTPQKLWPHGTCCNDGGYCSPPGANKDRYVVEFSSDASSQTVSTYTIVLKVPADIECERCVLQWTYFTANSADTYPEVFWNCADVTIKAPASRAPLAATSRARATTPAARAAPPAAAPPAAQPPPAAAVALDQLHGVVRDTVGRVGRQPVDGGVPPLRPARERLPGRPWLPRPSVLQARPAVDALRRHTDCRRAVLGLGRRRDVRPGGGVRPVHARLEFQGRSRLRRIRAAVQAVVRLVRRRAGRHLRRLDRQPRLLCGDHVL